MKQNAVVVLRWIGILPLACIAYVVGYAVLIAINWITVKFWIDSDGDGGWMSLYVWPVIATGAAAFYFVSVGKWLATQYKKWVGLTLFIILCMISGMAFLGMFIVPGHYSVIFPAIAQIIGGLIAFLDEESND